jgi:hypothetical protein
VVGHRFSTLNELLAWWEPHRAEIYPELEVPTFSGARARRALVAAHGLPNSYPRRGEFFLGRCRVLFVDDEQDGKPMAFWIPD